MQVVRFTCAHCKRKYETEWKDDLDLSFVCSCDTPLTVKVLRAEPDEPTPADTERVIP